MEIQTSPTKITRLGKKTLINNNILILEIDKKGLLTKNTFLNKEDMNKLKFTQDTTQKSYSKDKFMYEFLYSLRQKINDPLGKKKIK